MRILFAIIALTSLSSVAKDNVQLLSEATQSQEDNLLEKHTVLSSQWFEKYCMQLANDMDFDDINQCKIIDSPHINAYVLANGHVYFSLNLLKQINNKHQLASILAHENAHLELDHYTKRLERYQNPGVFFPKSKFKKMLKKHESQADDWSKKQLNNYGFDSSQIYFFMQRVIKINGNKRTNTHIKPSKRMKKNNSAELIDKKLIRHILEL